MIETVNCNGKLGKINEKLVYASDDREHFGVGLKAEEGDRVHVVGDEDEVAESHEARGVDLRVEERDRVQVERATGGRSLCAARHRTRRGSRAQSLQLEHVELHANLGVVIENSIRKVHRLL